MGHGGTRYKAWHGVAWRGMACLPPSLPLPHPPSPLSLTPLSPLTPHPLTSSLPSSLGIDGLNTISNHVLEVNVILGIEAARTKISDEISYIMAAYGIHIDLRHLMLLR